MALKPQAFGTALKNARKEHRLTQAELAERLDISLSYVKDLEYFRGLPSLELFASIIELFNLSADDIIHPDANLNSPAYQKISRLLNRCSEAQLNIILATAEAVVTSDRQPTEEGQPKAGEEAPSIADRT